MSTWMVVEDEPDIYEVLLAMFEVWGIEGVAFTDGSEAVAWIDDVDAGRVQVEQLPELALLDIRLPEVSGPEVAARLRQSPKLKNIAIVLITAYRLTPAEEEKTIADAQADMLIYKPPPRPVEFREILEQARAKRAAIAEQEAAAEAEVLLDESPEAAVVEADVVWEEEPPVAPEDDDLLADIEPLELQDEQEVVLIGEDVAVDAESNEVEDDSPDIPDVGGLFAALNAISERFAPENTAPDAAVPSDDDETESELEITDED